MTTTRTIPINDIYTRTIPTNDIRTRTIRVRGTIPITTARGHVSLTGDGDGSRADGVDQIVRKHQINAGIHVHLKSGNKKEKEKVIPMSLRRVVAVCLSTS